MYIPEEIYIIILLTKTPYLKLKIINPGRENFFIVNKNPKNK